MSHISAHNYEEFHESRESLREGEDTSLYCVACGLPFIPTEPMTQRDDDCLCEECAEAIEKMKEGVIS